MRPFWLARIAVLSTLGCIAFTPPAFAQSAYITNFFNPIGVAATPDTSTIYVTNLGSNTVSVIDAALNTVINTIPVGSSPIGVAVTPDGGAVFVVERGSNTVSVISTATNTITSTIAVGSLPECVAVGPDGSTAYVTNEGSNFRTDFRATGKVG
jgi:YVTN family beta-propeller protein